MAANCIFCKIIKGTIPSHKLFENDLVFAFLDIGPLNKGHALVIPKHHAQFLHQIPDEASASLLPVAKKIALALGSENYNILQNNGRLAHQEVEHVHVHVIPKDSNGGLVIEWNTIKPNNEEFSSLKRELVEKISKM
jgi:diadenosine tetraphosphate (Ap4A) HIT family hydrolase